mmetsp:Transcript_1464/g.5399  ORF Transcript_1464/g.5399 Transcript_1464/m.5399 type:complete len:137 (+) Transcript_1464:112-522(+)
MERHGTHALEERAGAPWSARRSASDAAHSMGGESTSGAGSTACSRARTQRGVGGDRRGVVGATTGREGGARAGAGARAGPAADVRGRASGGGGGGGSSSSSSSSGGGGGGDDDDVCRAGSVSPTPSFFFCSSARLA